MNGIYWLASYPKSGNTWFRAFLSNLQDDGERPVDINSITTGPIASARGWLDEVLGFDTAEMMPNEIERLRPEVYRWSMHQGGISYHKIHDAYALTVDGEPLVSHEATLGALYIIRNPLDVASSAANHWHCSMGDAVDRLCQSDFALCKDRRAMCSQVRQLIGNWSEHVLSWVDAPGLNVEVIRYEDMLSTPQETFTRAARFLHLPSDPDRVAKALRFSDFSELVRQEAERGFRERPARAGRFFRKGQSGDGKLKLSLAQVERLTSVHADVMQRFGYY